MDKTTSWANYQAEKELGAVTYKTYNIAGTKAPTETTGHHVPMSQPTKAQPQTQPVAATPCALPINQHLNPTDLGVTLRISYRLFNSSPLRHKRFDLSNADSHKQIQDFIEENNAKAELVNGKWTLTNKGLVDYMVISYLPRKENV